MQKNTNVILGVTLASVVLVAAGMGLVVDIFTSVPDFKELLNQVEVPIKLANGEKSTRWMGPNAPLWVPMGQISNHLLMAVISSEDTTFFSHNGVDLHELREAIKKDLAEKRWARGASTLTQQLLKNVYLGQQKTLIRKVKEVLWAGQLEKALTKSQILCFYVNMVEWGPGLYGIREAASHYFKKSASELTPKESAFLAMLLPSPIRYHAYFERRQLSPWAASRVGQILRVMNSMGFIDDETYESARHQSLWGETEIVPDLITNVPPAPPDDEVPPVGADVPLAAPSATPSVEKTPSPEPTPSETPNEEASPTVESTPE